MVNNVIAETSQDLLMESVHLSDKINLGSLPPTVKSRTKTEATIPVDGGGYVFIFTFGSVVFFNVGKAQQMEFLRALGPAPEDAPTDDFRISVRPEERDKVMFGQVVLPELSEARLRLVARPLAQSTALETVERMVESLVERSAKMTDVMKLGGRVPGHEKDLVRFIGAALDARRNVLSSLAVLDAPEATWDDPVLDRLYTDMRTAFEIDLRLATLEKKIELVVDGCEILVDLVKSRREQFLELVVIFLIALEIIVPVLMYKPF